MSAIWTLEIGGQTKEIHEWGLGNVTLTLRSLAIDTLSAVRITQNFDAAALDAYGGTVKLYRTDEFGSVVKVFEGRRTLVPGEASALVEGQAYTWEGPWAALARNVYRQIWTGGIGGVLQSIYTSHILQSGSVASQITKVLEYSRDQLALPLQIGTVTAPIVPPVSEIVDRTCAAVIQDAVQYAPDCVGWFDYTTSPPTFHLQPRAALPAVTLPMPDVRRLEEVRLESLRVTPRPDIQVPSVEITFETESTVDGEKVFGFARQRWPLASTGFEDGCLAATVNLQGFSATTIKATLEAETIAPTDLEWWKRMSGKLRDPDVFNLELVAGSVIRTDDETGDPAVGLPRKLISGVAGDWMTNPDGSAVAWQREVVSARFNYQKYDDVAGEPRTFKQEYIAVTIVTTNAPEGETDYSELATFEAGESAPGDLAEYLYNSLHPLHYDVSATLVEEDPSFIVGPGKTINVSGSDAAYATMAALVQEATINIDGGQTAITAGPPKHLSLSDILTLLRANRIRRRWTNPATQETGELGGREVNLGQGTGDTNATHGDGPTEKLVVRKLVDSILNKFKLDPEDPAFALAPADKRTIGLREVCVTEGGVKGKMLVLGSASYA